MTPDELFDRAFAVWKTWNSDYPNLYRAMRPIFIAALEAARDGGIEESALMADDMGQHVVADAIRTLKSEEL